MAPASAPEPSNLSAWAALPTASPLGAAAIVAGCAAAVTAARALLVHYRLRPPTLRLTYLNIKGKAEAIRLALTVGGIPFEDVRVGYDGIKALRSAGKLPYGQVPLLEINGKPYSQSGGLLRWAGKQAGLYPEELQLEIDAVEGCIADINSATLPLVYQHALGRNPLTGGFYAGSALSAEQVDAVKAHLEGELLPAKFAQLERVLISKGGPYMLGAKLTTCDLSVYVLGSEILDGSYCDGLSAGVLGNCPHLLALIRVVDALPEVSAWNRKQAARRADEEKSRSDQPK